MTTSFGVFAVRTPQFTSCSCCLCVGPAMKILCVRSMNEKQCSMRVQCPRGVCCGISFFPCNQHQIHATIFCVPKIFQRKRNEQRRHNSRLKLPLLYSNQSWSEMFLTPNWIKSNEVTLCKSNYIWCWNSHTAFRRNGLPMVEPSLSGRFFSFDLVETQVKRQNRQFIASTNT